MRGARLAMAFLGTYDHSVDAKGRVSLPARFRKELPDEVVIVPVTNEDLGKALYVFSSEAFAAWKEGFFKGGPDGEDGYNSRNKKHVALMRYLNARAAQEPIDAAGRVKLSAKHREAADIEKDVRIVGNDDHIEIWSAQVFDEEPDDADPFAAFLEG